MKLLFTTFDVEFDNHTVRNFARRFVSESNSCIGSNLLFINQLFNVDLLSQKYCIIRNVINVSSLKLTDQQRVIVNVLCELAEYTSILDYDETQQLIKLLCIN